MDREEEYWQAITAIEAQNLLENVRVIQVPYMKQEDFSKYFDRLRQAAFSYEKPVSAPVVSVDDFAKMFGSLGG